MRTRLLFVGGPLLAAAVAAGVVLVLARGSDDGPGDPAAFMTTLIAQIAGNDYADAWITLHPAQQRIATRDAYVSCESQSPIPGKLSSVQVVDISDEDVEVAGEGTAAGKSRSVPRRALVIGLDCAAPQLVFDRWLDDLPNIRALTESGRWGVLRS